MKIHLITEGPTDRLILKALLNRMIERQPHLISESKTQKKNRSVSSLLDYAFFSKFLHYAFYHSVDVIITCLDNDAHELDRTGISIERKEIIEGYKNKFLLENQYIYPTVNPCFIIIVPVETLDYWVKCIKMRTTNCTEILNIRQINKAQIKSLTYGEQNIHFGWMIDDQAITNVINQITGQNNLIEKLECLPCFKDFQTQLENCLS